MGYLGIDLGTKRVGVAFAPAELNVAVPLVTLDKTNRKNFVTELKKIIAKHGILRIVVGLPVTLKGTEGIASQKIREEVKRYEKETGMDWILWDERLTTREVERFLSEVGASPGKKKEVVDQLAAQKILQSYLDQGPSVIG